MTTEEEEEEEEEEVVEPMEMEAQALTAHPAATAATLTLLPSASLTALGAVSYDGAGAQPSRAPTFLHALAPPPSPLLPALLPSSPLRRLQDDSDDDDDDDDDDDNDEGKREEGW